MIGEQLALTIVSFPSCSKSASKKVNVGTAKAEYDLAAQLGQVSKSQVMCRQRYATCPFTGEEMMSALRNSNL